MVRLEDDPLRGELLNFNWRIADRDEQTVLQPGWPCSLPNDELVASQFQHFPSLHVPPLF